jgi:hypothetical protein
MKKFVLSCLVMCLLTPSLGNAADPAPAASGAPTASSATSSAAPAAAETSTKKAKKAKGDAATGAKKSSGPKHCNPAKSKPCGNACIPLSRTCHKS